MTLEFKRSFQKPELYPHPIAVSQSVDGEGCGLGGILGWRMGLDRQAEAFRRFRRTHNGLVALSDLGRQSCGRAGGQQFTTAYDRAVQTPSIGRIQEPVVLPKIPLILLRVASGEKIRSTRSSPSRLRCRHAMSQVETAFSISASEVGVSYRELKGGWENVQLRGAQWQDWDRSFRQLPMPLELLNELGHRVKNPSDLFLRTSTPGEALVELQHWFEFFVLLGEASNSFQRNTLRWC